MIEIQHLRKEYPASTPLKDVNTVMSGWRYHQRHRTIRHRKINIAAMHQYAGNTDLRAYSN